MSTATEERIQLVDPRQAYAKPPFEDQEAMKMPGSTEKMNPRPDHGEESYEGSGKLKALSKLASTCP